MSAGRGNWDFGRGENERGHVTDLRGGSKRLGQNCVTEITEVNMSRPPSNYLLVNSQKRLQEVLATLHGVGSNRALLIPGAQQHPSPPPPHLSLLTYTVYPVPTGELNPASRDEAGHQARLRNRLFWRLASLPACNSIQCTNTCRSLQRRHAWFTPLLKSTLQTHSKGGIRRLAMVFLRVP